MPYIVFGIHFEAQVGNYFEEGYAWHNRTGSHNPWSGFRMMEFHNLYFDFELPWWNLVNKHPRLHLPNTMEYLQDMFDGGEFEIRLKLIKRGLNAGQDELIKITRKYLL